MGENEFLVFDLETQRTADAVGGWRNAPDMKMSIGVIWDSAAAEFAIYREADVEKMIEHLCCGRTVVGFNHVGFDYQVVSGYRSPGVERKTLMKQLQDQKNFDLLLDLQDVIGHRVKLGSVTKATLETGKSADGLQALDWYAKYEETGNNAFLQKIIDYCRQDVQVTKDLYLRGMKQGYVFYESLQGYPQSAGTVE